MRRAKRRITPFSLSFLDIMACGFGAVTLLFLILKHDVNAIESADPNLAAEVNLLQEDIRIGEEDLVKLRNSLALIEGNIITTEGLSQRVLEQIEETRRELSIQSDPQAEIALLRKQVEELEKETAQLEEEGRDEDVRRFVGEGDRQYLTGLKLGGQRVLILVDASASMLAETIVNVVRRRNMDDAIQRNSPKWQRAIRTVEWLLAQLPPQSRYQLYSFNTQAKPLITSSAGQWQTASDNSTMDQAVRQLRQRVPSGGTSLHNAFAAIGSFEQKPDNLFLITDGLPTQGEKPPRGNTISGKDRAKLFNKALDKLPSGLPVNVILFPMEGDPAAAALFWQLGLASKGAFLSPSRDWP